MDNFATRVEIADALRVFRDVALIQHQTGDSAFLLIAGHIVILDFSGDHCRAWVVGGGHRYSMLKDSINLWRMKGYICRDLKVEPYGSLFETYDHETCSGELRASPHNTPF